MAHGRWNPYHHYTTSLAVPVYVKDDNVYRLSKCVQSTNSRSQCMTGKNVSQVVSLIFADTQNPAAIFVLRGDRVSVGLCSGVVQDTSNVHNILNQNHKGCKPVEDVPNHSIVPNETTLIAMDQEHKVTGCQSVFCFNSSFKKSVPACHMEQYVVNVCTFQHRNIQRILNNIRCYQIKDGFVEKAVQISRGLKRKNPG